MKRFIISKLLILVLIAITPIYANAYESGNMTDTTQEIGIIVRPRWTDTTSVTINLTASGNTLRPTLTVVPKSSSLVTSGTLFLERKNGSSWVSVASWTVNQSGNVLYSQSYNGVSGHTYRARFSGKTGSDSVSITSSTKTL